MRVIHGSLCNGDAVRYTKRYDGPRLDPFTATPVTETHPLATTDDSTLAHEALSGADSQGAALQELCRRFAPRARLYGLRHLRDPQAADDLAQEALLIFLEALTDGRLEDPDRVGHYLLGVCRNLLWNSRRAAQRRQHVLDRFGPELVAAASEPYLPEVDADRLEACLAKRSQRERQILLLTFHEDCDAETIAARMNLTSGNVRVIRHRVLRTLRDCLEGDPGREGK